MHWEDLEGAGGEGGGRGDRDGNTCKPMAVSFQCMTKSTTKKKKCLLNKKYIWIYKKREYAFETWFETDKLLFKAKSIILTNMNLFY